MATKKGEKTKEGGVLNVEEAVEEHKDVKEDLSDVDVGLGEQAELFLAVQQRFQYALNYHRLASQAQNVRLSISANEVAGNTKGIAEFKSRLESLEPEIKHSLRSIKAIDKQFPKAKKLMQEMVEKQNQKAIEQLFG